MISIKTEAKIKGLGKIVSCEGAKFDRALRALKKAGANNVPTSRDMAYARIHDATNTVLSKGTYVREGMLFIPQATNKRLLLRESLVLQYPRQASQSTKDGESFLLPYLLPQGLIVNEYLETVGKDNYFIMRQPLKIPLNRLGEDELAVWLFQDQAKSYGLFLKRNSNNDEAQIFLPHVDRYIDEEHGAFASQLRLNGTKNFVIADGACPFFVHDPYFRGIKYETSRLPAEYYTPAEIHFALASMNMAGLEKKMVNELRRKR